MNLKNVRMGRKIFYSKIMSGNPQKIILYRPDCYSLFLYLSPKNHRYILSDNYSNPFMHPIENHT